MPLWNTRKYRSKTEVKFSPVNNQDHKFFVHLFVHLLHLRTFLSVEDNPPLTSRFFNTWKNSSLMNSSQHSGHLHWISSWIEVFWAHCSGKFTVRLPGHLFTHGRCSTTDYKAPRHLESRFCHEGKSTFWPFILDQTTNRHFLSPQQWYMVLPDSNWPRFHLWKTLYHGQ